ncbi:MAG: hypothetical protein ACLP0L_23035 [Solirubrobacteraceae bacterium]
MTASSHKEVTTSQIDAHANGPFAGVGANRHEQRRGPQRPPAGPRAV